jgi:transmembrane sensor
MLPNEIEELIERYNAGKASPEEVDLVESWYAKYQSSSKDIPVDFLEKDQKESLNQIIGQIKSKPSGINWQQLSIAASILILFTAGLFFYIIKSEPNRQAVAKNVIKPDLTPGGNKAILTLSNGQSIVLNGAKNGTLAKQGNTDINKLSGSAISYQSASSFAAADAVIYNTATTPRGGQFQFILSDGTKVWLNSASSIKFPVAFNSNERKVELTGEAYFEVAHDAKRPFRVVSNQQQVEVLGTHFNINAYNDEDVINTTLLEGSVKVTSANTAITIVPGQQAQFKDGKINVAAVNVDDAVAWKNGLFNFNDNSIEEVMKQLSRWYDVDIKYEGQLPSRRFSGEISRNVNASQILDILSFKKIHYRIEGKSIIVMP